MIQQRVPSATGVQSCASGDSTGLPVDLGPSRHVESRPDSGAASVHYRWKVKKPTTSKNTALCLQSTKRVLLLKGNSSFSLKGRLLEDMFLGEIDMTCPLWTSIRHRRSYAKSPRNRLWSATFKFRIIFSTHGAQDILNSVKSPRAAWDTQTGRTELS